MRIPEAADRDFTASAFVVRNGEVLLVDHRKLDKWVQPGGHIDSRETPDEAARREVYEETGVKIELHPAHRPSHDFAHSENLPEPFRINLHQVYSGHWHIDFAYLAIPTESDPIPTTDEHRGQRWFAESEITGLDRIDHNTKQMGLDAIHQSQ